MKSYSLSDKYRYFCEMSKKGSKKSNGQLLTDFERGVYMGKAISIQENAKRYNRKRTKDQTINLGSMHFGNERTYSEEELNSLFDN